MSDFNKARRLLKFFKGDAYQFGPGALEQAGSAAARVGKRAALIRDTFPGSDSFIQTIKASLRTASVRLCEEITGASPNCPLQDLERITRQLKKADPDAVISFGGGSTIDAAKAAEVLRSLGGQVEDYFGTNLVTQARKKQNKLLRPHVAIQTAASSAAHLTKYSNITHVETGQKKLIVDEAIVPARPIFDYAVTYKAPMSLTIDGAIDGIAHCLEVLYSAAGKEAYENAAEIAEAGIGLIVKFLPVVVGDPGHEEGRQGLCYGTDLGGYAIMVGGTNGGHLTSFSLVDVLSHGRACGIMNPYYTVLFAPKIEQPLRLIGDIYRQEGFITADIDRLSGRDLGIAVAEGMLAFSRKVGLPATLSEVKGFGRDHIQRALTAAKNPQLKMKLQNMPVPLTAEMVDEYMGPVLEAAACGDLTLIKNVS